MGHELVENSCRCGDSGDSGEQSKWLDIQLMIAASR